MKPSIIPSLPKVENKYKLVLYAHFAAIALLTIMALAFVSDPSLSKTISRAFLLIAGMTYVSAFVCANWFYHKKRI